MLTRMQRYITKQETIDLLAAMRREVPGITIRTTLMVGFPGETDADFEELMTFVRDARFDRMGAFAYSEEDIATELSEEKVGETLRVIIDREEGDYYIVRTEADSPEVDCEVLIAKSAERPLTIGNFYQVEITDSEEFDLFGVVRWFF